MSSAAGRYGGGRLTPPQEKRRPAPLQEKRRPSESSQLTERKRHWKAGEFPAGAAAGRDGVRPAPPPEKRHWKAGEFLGTAAPPDSKASRTPLKNIKKRLDARADAKAWACRHRGPRLQHRLKELVRGAAGAHHPFTFGFPCLNCSIISNNPQLPSISS